MEGLAEGSGRGGGGSGAPGRAQGPSPTTTNEGEPPLNTAARMPDRSDTLTNVAHFAWPGSGWPAEASAAAGLVG